MNKRPDMTETLTSLIAELRKLPNSEAAMLYLGDLTELMARQTKYVVWRSGLLVSIGSYVGLLVSYYFYGGTGGIEPSKVVAAIVLLGLVLAVVAVLEYQLKRRPLERSALRAFVEQARMGSATPRPGQRT